MYNFDNPKKAINNVNSMLIAGILSSQEREAYEHLLQLFNLIVSTKTEPFPSVQETIERWASIGD